MALNLMGYNLKFLYICGVGQRKKNHQFSWKEGIYILFQLALFSAFIPSFIGLMLAVDHFWGDIAIMTNILCPGLSLVAAFLPAGYIFFNWSNVEEIVDVLETKSIFTNALIQSKDNLKQILDDTKRKAKLITQIVGYCQFVAASSWIAKPIVLYYLRDEVDNSVDHLSKEESMIEQWMRLIYIIWFPIDPTYGINYYLLYFYQCFVSYAFYNYTASIFSFIFVLIMYSASQFRIVATAIKDIDNFGIKESEYSNSKQYFRENGEHYTEISEKNISEVDELQTLVCDSMAIEVVPEIHSEEAYCYVRECIRMHQSAIEFAKEVNALFSPCFMIYISLETCILVAALFQLSLGNGIEVNGPFYGVVTMVIIQILGFCWPGQTLIDESLAVEQAAYNVFWYSHGTNLKKLIFMIITRSQKQVQLTGSGFFNLSLDTFAAILNTSYQWFTVLLKMNETS